MLKLIRILPDLCVIRHMSYGTRVLHNQLRSTVYQEYNEATETAGVKNQSHDSDVIMRLPTTACDVSALLGIVATESTKINKINYAFQAIHVMADWTMCGKIKFTEIEKNKLFPEFIDVVEKHANQKKVPEIIKALENLMQMGVTCNNFLVETLENDLLWNVTRVAISSVLKILPFQTKFLETEKQKKVLEVTIQAIEKRWTEITYYYDFVTIYEYSKYFQPQFIGHIDDRLMETAEGMNIPDLSKVFCALSHSHRRPTPVLRSLTYHMFKSNGKLTPRQSVNLIYAMSSLNFIDQALLGKLSSDIIPQIPEITQSNLIGSLLICIGKIRWREKPLLDILGEWILKEIDQCRVNDLISLLLTLATVSYVPDNVSNSFGRILSKIDRASVPEDVMWIQLVWSLIILGKAKNDDIASILDPAFASRVASDDPAHVGIHLKLMHINAYAKHLANSYNGPSLKVTFMDNLLITQSSKERSQQAYVSKVLHNFLPPPKYIKENIRTPWGFTINAAIIVDKNKRPMALEESSCNFNEENLSPLPLGAQRIAILVWNFKDFAFGSQELCSFNPLIIKILTKLGYKVVSVPYFDISESSKIVKSVQYFQKKIKDLDNN